MAGLKVTTVSASRTRAVAARRSTTAAAATGKVQTKIMQAATVASGVALAHPLAAEAAVTPSLKNLLYSVLAGGSVLFLLFGAVSVVAQFDPVDRK